MAASSSVAKPASSSVTQDHTVPSPTPAAVRIGPWQVLSKQAQAQGVLRTLRHPFWDATSVLGTSKTEQPPKQSTCPRPTLHRWPCALGYSCRRGQVQQHSPPTPCQGQEHQLPFLDPTVPRGLAVTSKQHRVTKGSQDREGGRHDGPNAFTTALLLGKAGQTGPQQRRGKKTSDESALLTCIRTPLP